MTQTRVEVVNELGLHLRAAARFVETASRWPCQVLVSTDGSLVEGKSLLALSSLLARKGSTLTIQCHGEGEVEAAEALAKLVAAGFSGLDPS